MGGDVGNIYHKVSDYAQNAYNKVFKGETAQPEAVPQPGDTPNPNNSQQALDDAAQKQKLAKGAAGTIFSSQGSGGLMSSGSAQSQRMLLGS